MEDNAGKLRNRMSSLLFAQDSSDIIRTDKNKTVRSPLSGDLTVLHFMIIFQKIISMFLFP